jgi:dual specificity phosphatase 12
VLVHCFRGRSRSATVVIAYLMYKHHYKLEKAFFKVKSKRDCINPHIGFLAQLKLFEAMEYAIDLNNVQYKMFRLYCASERMRKAKILFRDSLDKVLDVDPAGGLPGSAEAAAAAASKSRYPMIYKCRKCRRTLATAFNMLPHVRGETPNWMDDKWARLSEEDVIDDVSSPAGLDLCSQSVFITPVGWMENEIKQNLSGRLYCPNCQVRVGNYSWVLGDLCKGCGATVLPAFQLDMTEIIFRTHNRYLQSGYMARGPILV